MSHTAGPWEVRLHDGKSWNGCSIIAVDGLVVTAIPRRADRSYDTKAADARLIAAAPDLLDALRAFCGDYESTSERIPEIQAAYLHALEVIAKAEATT